MKPLKIIFDFYINASIHVALAVFAFLKITQFYFGLNDNENLNYFIFFGTITGYNFVKFAGVAKLHHRSLTDKLKAIQIFSFICFLVMCYFASRLHLKTILFTLPFSILTLLYAIPFLSGFHKNLRQISYLKIIVVALVWAGFTVLLPIFDANLTLDFNVILFAIQRFLIVIVLILPFDIRDVKFDAISLQTIPKKIGVKKTKKLGLILLIFTLVLEYLLAAPNPSKNSFLLFFFLTVLLLMRVKMKQSKYYSSFWVELIPVFWWIFILIIHNF